MKIAALYDIHGNLPALNAILKDLEKVKPDLIIFGGDIVSGPMPRQTLERIFSLTDNIRFIRGNGDREVVTAFDNYPLPPTMSEKGRQKTQWVAEQLTRPHRDFLSELPETLTIEVDGLGDILFCHATPRSDDEIFTPVTSEERLSKIFADVKQEVVICGHTHIQFERQLGNIRILNAGSVGMPFAEQPGAYWLLIYPKGYKFCRTTYDLKSAAKEIIKSGDPQVNEFVERNLLNIPTVTQATEFLERMSRRK
ncbi:metallophosphoesterase family protein [Heyndrickxia camelliae]|uniref:Phosphoesterase n=1 Tax=Heyndrickxia camelliae TaxID=1707093 RepID=A0A2N3LGT9_9BACI|nr:metallophosphoesterase family protein [Heyndrickxia camelliae]PKR83733.1 phosphoesterase [Heyndrickxia camelliae]